MTLAVVALPLVGGCLQDASSASETTTLTNSFSNAAPFAAAAPQAVAENQEAIPIEEDSLADAPVKPLAAPVVPIAVKTSAAAAEIVKLANSGLDEGVMLAYVTNSASRFDLNADDIVYLNDIGVPPAVVTAMIQRDQAYGVGPAVPLAPIATQPPPTNQWGPNPADVAPQAVPQPGAAQAEAAPAGPPAQAIDNNTFYTSLSPYGTWMQVEGYGMVWQPTVTVINSSWRPYFDSGRWVWTDAGWYWMSDYSWGWAPFHYGRWFRHNRAGWCWAPDTLWGPSWVTWRYDSDYCGWAPLPPSAYYRSGFGFSYYGRSVGFGFSFGLGVDYYSFVHFRDFRGRHLDNHRLQRDEVHRIYNHTTVVTKIVGNHNTVINTGFGVGPVSRHSEVRRVTLREEPGRSPSGRGDRLASDGRSLAVYRPQVAPLPSPATTLAAAGNRGRLPGGSSLAPANRDSSRPGSRLVERNGIAAPKPMAAPSSVVEKNGSRLPSAGTSSRVSRERSSGASSQVQPPVAPTPVPGVARSSDGSRRSSSRLIQAPATAPQNLASPAAKPVEKAAPRGASSLSKDAANRDLPTSSGGNSTVTTIHRSPLTVSPRESEAARDASRLVTRPATQPAAIPSAPAAPSASATVSAPTSRQTPSAWGNRTIPSRSTSTYTPPTPSAPVQNYSAQSRVPTPSVSAPTANHSAPSRSVPSYSPPSYTAPSRMAAPPVSAPSPSYSAPSRSVPSYSPPSYTAPSRVAAPSVSAPSPSYSAPSRSVPSYSPPVHSAPSRSAPAPSYSAPSAPSRSYSAPSRSSDDNSRSGGRSGRRGN